ncbi:hypothetical protein Lser_V15G15054 [Lactuca serriola]
MEKRRRRRSELEDIPNLYHDIQSRLPVEEAARTSVLSKSWLHTWSTIPIIRFPLTPAILVDKEEDKEKVKPMEELVDRTLKRYLRDNIPIEIVDLIIDMTNQESASLAEKWIRLMATKSSTLKQLSLRICISSDYSVTLPAEILSSGRNLTDLEISCSSSIGLQMMNPFSMTSHPVIINCVCLRRLQLKNVHIIEEVLDDIFSICRLLVRVELSCCTGFRRVKVQNLHRLNQFRINSAGKRNPVVLEINDVPNIRLFNLEGNTLLPSMDSLGSVTTLWLAGMIVDDAFLHIIKSKFPFLESLTLDMKLSKVESFDITCASMKRLSLLWCPHMLIDVKVYAPKLVFFYFSGETTMPRLLFPEIVLEEIQIELSLIRRPMDNSFFLKMREAFTLSRKCDIQIQIHGILASDINLDLDDQRRRVPFPAMNVQRVSLRTFSDDGLWRDSSPFFDAFFMICHPKHVEDQSLNNNSHFCKLMMLEKKTRKGYWGDYLKDVEIRRQCLGDEKWETLTNSWRSFLDRSVEEWSGVEFKLYWHSVK